MNSYRRQEGYLPVQLVGIRALVAGFRFYRYNCKTTDRAIEVYSTLEEAKRVATINHTHVAGRRDHHQRQPPYARRHERMAQART